MTTRPDGSRAPRSATILKSRLVEAHRDEFEAALGWAASDPAVEAAAARITGARRRFVIGAATSFTYASLLAAKLSNALAQVILIDGTIVRPLDILSDVRASDVMIVVSFRQYRRYTIDTALPFAQAGGALVLITDSAANPLAEHAAETIVIGPGDPTTPRAADDDLSMHPETPDVSPAVVAMVIDLLSTLSSASAKGANRRFAERQRLASELGLHHD